MYEAKRAAETLEFGGLSNSKDCRENAFKLAKQMMAENQDVVGDPCIMNDAGCMVVLFFARAKRTGIGSLARSTRTSTHFAVNG